MDDYSQDATEELYPYLSYSLTTGCGPRSESHDYLLNFRVEILAEYPPDAPTEDTREIRLGNLHATLIRSSQALNEGFSYYDLFDNSQETADLGSALYEPGFEDFIEPIRSAFSDAFSHNDILYIQWLALAPFARGQRLGISCLHRFIGDWEGDCALVAIQPKPIQFAPDIQESALWQDLSLGDLPQDREKSTAILTNHYRGLGFQSVGSLPYMLRCPVNRQLPLDEMALVDSISVPRKVLEKL